MALQDDLWPFENQILKAVEYSGNCAGSSWNELTTKPMRVGERGWLGENGFRVNHSGFKLAYPVNPV
jgi:hypothetical protein